jgi:hypothetical protein
MATLELFDGTTTLDLLGSTYKAKIDSLQGLGGVAQDIQARSNRVTGVQSRARVESIDLVIEAAAEANLRTAYNDLQLFCAVARSRRLLNQGTICTLVTQIGSTGSNDISYRILWAELQLGSDVLNVSSLSQNVFVNTTLSLTLEPLGRLAEVNVADQDLENEVASPGLAYMDVSSLTGAEHGLVNVRIWDENNGGGTAWAGDKTMWLWSMSGERHDATVFLQASDAPVELVDPTVDNDSTFASGATGGLATNASAGSASYMQWTQGTDQNHDNTDWTSVGYFPIPVVAANIPPGTFKIMPRLAINNGPTDGWLSGGEGSNVRFALGYVFGGVTVTPDDDDDSVWTLWDVNVNDEWHVRPIGTLTLPPHHVPEGETSPDLELRVYVAFDLRTALDPIETNAVIKISLDSTMMALTEENFVEIASVGTDDRVLVAGQDANPAVYLTDGSDVIQQIADYLGSGAWKIGPDMPTRFFCYRDDVGDPSTVGTTMSIDYLPQTGGV